MAELGKHLADSRLDLIFVADVRHAGDGFASGARPNLGCTRVSSSLVAIHDRKIRAVACKTPCH